LIWLVLTVLILLGYSLQSVAGSVHYSMLMPAYGTVSSPSVILEGGNCSGTSTIYTNKTSAKVNVTAPVPIYDFIDNNVSNVDSSVGKGTHSNFTAQQYGPDSIYDALTETNIGTGGNWGITSSSFASTSTHTTYRYMGGTSPNTNGMIVTRLYIRCGTTGTAAIALYTGGTLSDPTGATKRTEAYNVAVSAGWNTIDVPDYSWPANTITWIGWCHSASIYYSTSSSDCGNFQSGQGRWNQPSPADADQTAPMPTNPGAGSFSNAWYAVYAEYTVLDWQLDLEGQWTGADYDETNEELAIYVNKWGNTYSLDATGGYMIIGSGTPNWGSVTGTISFWVKWDTVGNRPWGQHDNMETRFSGSNLVLDWGATGSLTSSTSFTNSTWYFIAIVWNENTDRLYLYVGDQTNRPTLDAYNNAWTSTVSTVGVTQNNFMASRGGVNPTDGKGDDLRYWNTERTLAQIQSDYKTELTGSETNLRSYFKLNNNFDDVGPNNNDGSGSGSYSFSSDVPFNAPENIRVDVWNGSAWQNLFTDLTNGWNNVSVSSYLNSSTFTIRFKGGTETSDITQDSWKIDATLLQVWTTQTYDYVLKVVNQGAGNWVVNMKVYGSSNIGRLSTLNISLHDGTSSNQIAVSGGSIVKSEGESYNLPGGVNSTIYISMSNLLATTAGTSYLYVYLKIRVPNTSTYSLYVITFEIT